MIMVMIFNCADRNNKEIVLTIKRDRDNFGGTWRMLNNDNGDDDYESSGDDSDDDGDIENCAGDDDDDRKNEDEDYDDDNDDSDIIDDDDDDDDDVVDDDGDDDNDDDNRVNLMTGKARCQQLRPAAHKCTRFGMHCAMHSVHETTFGMLFLHFATTKAVKVEPVSL